MAQYTLSSPRHSVLAIGLLALAAAGIAFFGFEAKALILIAGLILVTVIWLKPEYGILVFLTTFLLYYPSFLQGFGKITPNNVLGLIFCVLLVGHLIQERTLWIARVRQVQFMVGIGIVFLVSTWFSPEPPYFAAPMDRTFRELWDFYSQFAFLIFMIYFIRTPRHLKMILVLFFAIVLMTAFSALHRGVVSGEDYRATASFGIKMANNSNHLAFYSLMGIVTFWYLRQALHSVIMKSAAMGAIILLLFVVFLASSRNALLNLVFLSGVLTLESAVNLRKLVITVVVIAVLGLSILNLTPQQNLNRMFTFGSDPTQKEVTSSTHERLQSFKTGFQMFADSNVFLGLGPGNFRWIRQIDYDHKRIATHNSYLWALVGGGIPALILYLGLFWATWRDLRWMESHAPASANPPPLWMVKAVRTMLLLFLVFSLFTEAWLEIMFFLIVGLTIIMKRLYLPESSEVYAT